jgi:hypothetical protein
MFQIQAAKEAAETISKVRGTNYTVGSFYDILCKFQIYS